MGEMVCNANTAAYLQMACQKADALKSKTSRKKAGYTADDVSQSRDSLSQK
jgi:hypothetical protein